MMIIKYNN